MPKISELPVATTPLAGTEYAVLVQGGITKQVATADIVTSVNSQSGVVTLTASDVGALGVSANAVSASKLQTVRTISITGDGTGFTTFDGSANAGILLTVNNATNANNATTADRLSTPRTISLSGDVTGSATFDGTSSITISTTTTSPGTSTFLDLTDVTPSTYVGSENYVVSVNSAGTALEFVAASSLGSINGIDETNYGEATPWLKFERQAAGYDTLLFNTDSSGSSATFYGTILNNGGYQFNLGTFNQNFIVQSDNTDVILTGRCNGVTGNTGLKLNGKTFNGLGGGVQIQANGTTEITVTPGSVDIPNLVQAGGSGLTVATGNDGIEYTLAGDTHFRFTDTINQNATAVLSWGENYNANWNSGAWILNRSPGQFNLRKLSEHMIGDLTSFGVCAANDMYLGTRYGSIDMETSALYITSVGTMTFQDGTTGPHTLADLVASGPTTTVSTLDPTGGVDGDVWYKV